MIGHIGPQAAITLARKAATKYQTSDDITPQAAVTDYVTQIEPVLGNDNVIVADYLKEVRGAAVMELQVPASDALTQRRSDFMASLVQALDARIATEAKE